MSTPPEEEFLDTEQIIERISGPRRGRAVLRLGTLMVLGAGVCLWLMAPRFRQQRDSPSATASPMPSPALPVAGDPAAAVRVRLILRRPGALFLDGHAIGTQTHLDIEVRPGRHVVMARFGEKVLQHAIMVQTQPLTVVFEPRRSRVRVNPAE